MSHSNYAYKSPPTSNCCSTASAELKLYQAFIFSVPIFFTFILLFLFYLFYLRRRRADWSSLRMQTERLSNDDNNISRCELGLKKELREMLPIVVFEESFSVKDTQCSVCLGDYRAEDKLQQIPICEHTFHMDCIDLWLSTHTTCPLCRLSLLALSTNKSSTELPDNSQAETSQGPSDIENHNVCSPQSCSQHCEEPQVGQQISNLPDREERSNGTSSSMQVRDAC